MSLRWFRITDSYLDIRTLRLRLRMMCDLPNTFNKTPYVSVEPKQYTRLASQRFILTRKPNWSRYIDNLVVRAFQNTNAYMSEFDLVYDKWLFTLDSIHIAMVGLTRFVVNSSELRLFSYNHSDAMACEGFLYYWPFLGRIQRIPLVKVSGGELWYFPCRSPKEGVEQTVVADLRRHDVGVALQCSPAYWIM